MPCPADLRGAPPAAGLAGIGPLALLRARYGRLLHVSALCPALRSSGRARLGAETFHLGVDEPDRLCVTCRVRGRVRYYLRECPPTLAGHTRRFWLITCATPSDERMPGRVITRVDAAVACNAGGADLPTGPDLPVVLLLDDATAGWLVDLGGLTLIPLGELGGLGEHAARQVAVTATVLLGDGPFPWPYPTSPADPTHQSWLQLGVDRLADARALTVPLA